MNLDEESRMSYNFCLIHPPVEQHKIVLVQLFYCITLKVSRNLNIRELRYIVEDAIKQERREIRSILKLLLKINKNLKILLKYVVYIFLLK